MATVQYTKDVVTNQQFPSGIQVIKWVLADGDDGVPYYAPQYSGKSVQRTAATATAVATIEGTLVPEGTAAVFGAVHDPASTALVLNDANGTAIRQILEDCYAVRPVVTVAGCTVYLFVTTTARR